MRLTLSSIRSFVLLAGVACASAGTSSGEGAADAANTTPRLGGVFQSGSGGLAGEVNIAPTNRAGEFRATLSIRGGSAGQQMPWHVHTGRCNSNPPGVVVGSLVAYQLIQVRGDGNADHTQTVRTSLAPGQSYYVDVHPSRSDMERILGCADLNPASP